MLMSSALNAGGETGGKTGEPTEVEGDEGARKYSRRLAEACRRQP